MLRRWKKTTELGSVLFRKENLQDKWTQVAYVVIMDKAQSTSGENTIKCVFVVQVKL